MTMMGKTCPVRARAFSLSWDKRARRAGMSPLGTECLDIFSPPPGAREVMTQVERLSSRDTKIALRSVRIAACSCGRGQRACMVAPAWVVQHPHSAREQGATNRAHGIFGNPVTPREWFFVPLFVIDEAGKSASLVEPGVLLWPSMCVQRVKPWSDLITGARVRCGSCQASIASPDPGSAALDPGRNEADEPVRLGREFRNGLRIGLAQRFKLAPNGPKGPAHPSRLPAPVLQVGAANLSQKGGDPEQVVALRRP